MKVLLNSKFRDRNVYPSCGQFVVSSTLNPSNDPVCKSAPVFTWSDGGFSLQASVTTCSQISQGKTLLVITFSLGIPERFKIEDYFAGCTINSSAIVLTSECVNNNVFQLVTTSVNVTGIINVADTLWLRAPTRLNWAAYRYLHNDRDQTFAEIISIDPITRRFILRAQPVTWALNDPYSIRDALPLVRGFIITPGINSLELSTIGSARVNDWFRIVPPDYLTPNPIDRRISKIVNSTIFFHPPLDTAPAFGEVFEINQFSFDNVYPLQLMEPSKLSLYNVKCENLVLPNVKIYNHTDELTLVTVEIHNDSSASNSTKYLISSNHRDNNEAIFVIPVVARGEWLLIDSSYQAAAQPMLITLSDPLRVTIRLPDGKIFTPLQSDNKSPAASIDELNSMIMLELETVQNHVK